MSSELFSKLPGFRFHPTDHELVLFYLERKVRGTLGEICSSFIQEVNFYNNDPWELAADCYYFVPRESRPRPNRVAVSGYWKATGSDKRICWQGRCVGLKKTLVFYTGRAPKGTKTSWIMNEYRLPQSNAPEGADVSLCRLYKKNCRASPVEGETPMNNAARTAAAVDENKNLTTLSPISSTSMSVGCYSGFEILEEMTMESLFHSNPNDLQGEDMFDDFLFDEWRA